MPTSEEGPLAAVVEKPAADRAIAGLKAEGVYDTDRRITAHDSQHLALPVTTAPEETAVQSVTVQPEPEWRVRTLADRLRARGWSEAAIAAAPSSWAVIGEVVTARFEDCPRRETVGEALLALHGNAHTVLDVESITGSFREPTTTVVAGRGQTETVHREHGTAYGLDLAELMFAPGNKAERVRMGAVAAPDETVFDMFAGIGYFTLPMARAGATVEATEHNPVAFAYLRQNTRRNDVATRVRPHLVDCRAHSVTADRVVMGYYDAREYLPTAVPAVRTGGTLHVHDVAPREDPWRDVTAALAECCRDAGRSAEITDRRVVKSQNPAMDHVVIDARID